MTDRAKVCPREPTEAMMEAGVNQSLKYTTLAPMYSTEIDGLWRAMYDAAPEAPSDDALVERLRAADEDYTIEWGNGDLYGWAADRIESLTAELAQARAQPCPHVVTSDEGTQHCNLAESSVRDVKAELAQARARYEREKQMSVDYEQLACESGAALRAATERAQALHAALRKLRAGVSVITPEDAIALIDAALAAPQGEP